MTTTYYLNNFLRSFAWHLTNKAVTIQEIKNKNKVSLILKKNKYKSQLRLNTSNKKYNLSEVWFPIVFLNRHIYYLQYSKYTEQRQ